jgi:hydroxymethylpyrimidine/phosphomethylpyrimidine kinase
LGAGLRTDLKIIEHLGIDEAALTNTVTQKQYKNLFHVEQKTKRYVRHADRSRARDTGGNPAGNP